MYADKELIEFLKDKPVVKCATVLYKSNGFNGYDHIHPADSTTRYTLKCNHTNDEFNDFIKSLKFDYGNMFDSMELFGTIWFEEIGFEGTTWATRESNDDFEWWSYHKLPEIPSELLN